MTIEKVPLPNGTSQAKSYEWGLDVNLGTSAAPNWQSVRRMSAFAPTFPKTTEPNTSYDDLGAPNEAVTGRGFAAAFTVQGNRSQTTGLLLPELEAIVAAAKAKGAAAVLEVRWYHKPETGTPSPNEAGQALVTVEATRQNTGDAQNEVYSVSFTGKGTFDPIANPWAGWGAGAPTVSAVAPAAAGTGALVTITGTGFIGASAVKFGATAATSFTVVGAGTIVAVLPSGSAGSAAVTVTTTAGTSAAFPYTRAA